MNAAAVKAAVPDLDLVALEERTTHSLATVPEARVAGRTTEVTPMTLLQLAVQSGDLDKAERFYALVQQVKADERLRIIPVVVLTSSHEEKDKMRSYNFGVNAYVVKPVDFHEFVNAIKELGVFWAVINEPPPGSVKKPT